MAKGFIAPQGRPSLVINSYQTHRLSTRWVYRQYTSFCKQHELIEHLTWVVSAYNMAHDGRSLCLHKNSTMPMVLITSTNTLAVSVKIIHHFKCSSNSGIDSFGMTIAIKIFPASWRRLPTHEVTERAHLPESARIRYAKYIWSQTHAECHISGMTSFEESRRTWTILAVTPIKTGDILNVRGTLWRSRGLEKSMTVRS